MEEVYLGLDINTRIIGIGVLDKNDNILVSKAIKFKSYQSLEQRALIFCDYLNKLMEQYKFIDIFIEEPIVFIRSNSHAKTISILNRFNGMISFIVYYVSLKEPKMINPISSRSKLGIKIPKDKKTKKQKKQCIIDYVVNRYENSDTKFCYNNTSFGNYCIGTDDRCDAIVAVLGGKKIWNLEFIK